MGKRIIKVLSIIKRSLLEIIYPRDSKCIVCGEEDTYGLCHKCKSSITYCDSGELCLGYYKGALSPPNASTIIFIAIYQPFF